MYLLYELALVSSFVWISISFIFKLFVNTQKYKIEYPTQNFNMI